MKSSRPGTNTSRVEVTNVDTHGMWVLARDKEYFLPHEDYPWFKRAKLEDVLNVELHHGIHLYWPSLDVDLSLDCLENPGQYPLVAEG